MTALRKALPRAALGLFFVVVCYYWIYPFLWLVSISLKTQMEQTDRKDIRVVTAGCMGMCSSEPNVTVEVLDSEPIVYQHMNANRMRQVFRRHVLLGEVQTDFALGRM